MRFSLGFVGVLIVAALAVAPWAAASRTAVSPNLTGFVDEDQVTFWLQFADGTQVGGL